VYAASAGESNPTLVVGRGSDQREEILAPDVWPARAGEDDDVELAEHRIDR
jgi:hypothetical protein